MNVTNIKLSKVSRRWEPFPKWQLLTPKWDLDLDSTIAQKGEDPNANLGCCVGLTWDPQGTPPCILTIKQGYEWIVTGWPSATSNMAQAAMAHDALYKAMRRQALSKKARGAVDELFYEHLKQAGVWKFVAKIAYYLVKLGGWIFV